MTKEAQNCGKYSAQAYYIRSQMKNTSGILSQNSSFFDRSGKSEGIFGAGEQRKVCEKVTNKTNI